MNENLEKLIKEATTVLTIVKVVLILWVIQWIIALLGVGTIMLRSPLK